MKKIIIAEKPELAKAIALAVEGEKKYFNNKIETKEYTIVWAVGHILRHKNPGEIEEKYKKWNMEDLPIYFPKWSKIPIKGKENIVKNIKELLKNTKEVIHAGDPDDEGQYLIDEILEYCKYDGVVKRILINDNNTEAVKKAFQKMDYNLNYVNLGKAAEARAIADMIVGFNLSRFFTLYNNASKPLTVGRVQTPTLALVVNRDYEIKNHVKEKYYDLYLNIKINHKILKLKYSVPKSIEEGMIKDKETVEKIISEIEAKTGIVKINKKESYNSPPLPFNLAKLQIEANNKFGYSAQKTQDITQSLRDNHKAITYNRSDCEYLSEEHFKEAVRLIPEVMKKIGLENLKLNFDEENKSKCFNEKNITAHHAIIPTFSGELSKFNQEEKNIYELIAKRYIIQFMDKEKVEKIEAVVNVESNEFKVSSVKVLELGYKVIYEDDNEKEKTEYDLYDIQNGEYPVIIKNGNMKIEEKETKAKKPYTEASLLSDMTNISKYVKDEKIRGILKEKDKEKKGENGSIGTTATRANIITELFKRGYLEKKGKTVVSTELAKEYLSTLPESLKSADMTALWWSIQEEIKEGKSKKEKLTDFVLYQVIKIIEDNHTKIKTSVISEKKEVLCECPKCEKGDILEKNKAFYCSEYKNGCKFSLWKETKYFEQMLKINKKNALKLINGEKVEFKLKAKNGKEYKANFKMKLNGDYVNLEKDK
ncbi:type IA DNA topoisomerase [Leptotrichia sp. OH3620_COT-345]|uniref:DNA topoisomerase n=1 Tax=Leptotrichia sp. OH3620_COT-345 TaxID=2491048 RepID=UPI000F65610F|nr:DNA topoisomerase [Leptotrichia sp. OH3620_COT-345]RRD40347.1 type IA DNA topoisomerase [Leptotrichia sp. OH3620_COT-345]